MNNGIINFCMDFFEEKGVVFTKNNGKAIECIYNTDKYLFFPENPYVLFHKFKFKNIDIFKEISHLHTFKRLYKEKCEQDMNELLDLEDIEDADLYVNTQNLDYHKKEVKLFLEKYDILQISSPMATRKSNILEEVIIQCKNLNKSVLFITNRISLSYEIFNKFKCYNMKHYLQNNFNIGDSLIVQFDSLHKYHKDFFDVIVIDEISSLLLYASENRYTDKEDNYLRNINTFLSLKDKKIVLSDAFILLNPFKNKKIFKIYNEFREDIKVTEFTNRYTFFSTIIRESKRKKISVSANEKRILIKLQKQLEKRGIKTLLLTAETKNKKEIYDIFNTKDIDKVILFSPTLTVGVSIFNLIDIHFHYDNGSTLDVISSIQMLRRVRNVKNINYYIAGKKSFRSTNINNIKYNMNEFKILNKNGEVVGITHNGKILVRIKWMANIVKNTHKYLFRKLLKRQFKKIDKNEHKSEHFIL